MKVLVSACLLGRKCKYNGGSFSGKLISGSGVFAQALKDAGYRVIDAEDIK